MTAALANLWNSAIAQSTSESYRTGLNCFLRFASLSLVSYAGLPDLTEDLLIYFVTHCHSVLRLRFSTIKLYLCGIRFAYLQAGKYSPLADTDQHKLLRLSTICRAIRKQQGQATKPRLPITYHILQQIVTLLRSGVFSPFLCLMFEAACLVAFYGFLRCGEFTVKHSFDPAFNLCIGDISFVNHNQSVTIRLKSSKTDPFRKGVPVILYANSSLCPLTSLRKYLQSRTRMHHSLQDPLFISDNHVALTRTVFISKLKVLLQTLNHDHTSYSGHSFRIGAATSAAQAHVPDHLIKTLGRWTSDSYTRYIRTPPSLVAAAQRAMTLSDGSV